MKTSKYSLSALHILLFLIITIPLLAQSQPAEQDELLKIIPAEAPLVLRINNLQNSISQIDQFIQGVSPMPMGASMLVRMQLAGLLADPALSNLNMTGDFTVFLMLPAESAQQPQLPKPVIFGLIPLADFNAFTKQNQNCSTPDEKGVANITSKNFAGQTVKTIIKKIGNYTIFSTADNYDQLVNIANNDTSNKNFTKTLTSQEAQKALNEPVWIYLNFEQISKTLSPEIIQQLSAMPMMLNKSSQNLPIQQPQIEQIINVISGINYLSLTINPKPNFCLFTPTLSTSPDSEITQLLSSQSPAVQMLIQLLQAEPPQQNPQLNTISSYIPKAENADFIAQFNIIELQKSAAAFAPTSVPDVNFAAKTNAFCAVNFGQNSISAKIALPKEHLRELISYGQKASQSQQFQSQQPGQTAALQIPITQDVNLMQTETTEQPTFSLAPAQTEPVIDLKGVKFGMTPEQMFEILGKSTTKSGDHYYYFNLGLAVIINSEGFVEEFICGSVNPLSPMLKNCSFETKKGLSLGSAKQDIIAAYGNPSKTHNYPPQKNAQTLEYQNINTRFTIIDNNLVQIICRNPN